MYFTNKAQQFSGYIYFTAGTALGIFVMLIACSIDNASISALALVTMIACVGLSVIMSLLNRKNRKLAKQELWLRENMFELLGWLQSRVDLEKGLDESTLASMKSFLDKAYISSPQVCQKLGEWEVEFLQPQQGFLCMTERETRRARNMLASLLSGQDKPEKALV